MAKKYNHNKGILAVLFFILFLGLITSLPAFFDEIVIVFIILLVMVLIGAIRK